MPPEAEPGAEPEGGPGAEVSRRREYPLALVLGAAGAGVILLAARQVWARAVYTPPRPFPATAFAVSGQKLVPLASAAAIAALACLAAVAATRGLPRRAAGLLLALTGAGAAVAAAAAVTSGAVLSAAVSADPALSGSTTSGTASGGTSAAFIGVLPGHAVITGLPWRAAAVTGALAIVLAGLLTAWRGARWPVMPARSGRPGQRPEPVRSDPATMWELLSRDADPTVDMPPAGPASQRIQPADEVRFGSG